MQSPLREAGGQEGEKGEEEREEEGLGGEEEIESAESGNKFKKIKAEVCRRGGLVVASVRVARQECLTSQNKSAPPPPRTTPFPPFFSPMYARRWR